MKTKLLTLILLLTGLLIFTSCHHVLKGDTLLMSNKQEVKLGEQVHQELLKEFKLYQNQTVNKYVQGVGKKIVSKCDRKDITYHFYVLDTDIVNAFAAPGGYVYVTTGMLGFLNNEAELACVLGHEVGHITERHGAKRMREVLGYQILAIGLAASGVNIDAQILNLGVSLAMNGYSQENEFEADEKGIIYANRAGYNPHAMQNFFLRLEEKQKNKNEYNTFNRMLSSHPPTRSRINKAHEVQDKNKMMGVNTPKYYAEKYAPIKQIVTGKKGQQEPAKDKKNNKKKNKKK
ncbi:MAG: M48 family metallopeptidase [bacterium]|nr:M48 family metallopeptidase [bacterium]